MRLQSINARTGQPMGDSWAESTSEEIHAAAVAADSASSQFASTDGKTRATLLRAIADGIEAKRSALVQIADQETGLGVSRLEGEVSRTTFQLRGFADLVEMGRFQPFLDEEAVAGAPPVGRPQMTRVAVPVGPVAMFSASNFPFAFSVAGGDTASALAAGCPVVVKGHPAHPKLSREVASIVHAAVESQGLPEGVFQFVEGGSIAVGVALVQEPSIAAVAFTGSFKGGTALAKLASERERPIPFFGELGSVNPLVVMPMLKGEASDALAEEVANSISAGSGQFCTSPGVILVANGKDGDAFVNALASALASKSLHVMLTTGIRKAFDAGIQAWRGHEVVRSLLAEIPRGTEDMAPRPFLAEVSAADFVSQATLHEEVFGSAALVVRTSSVDEVVSVLKAVGGSLTVTLRGVPSGSEQPDEADIAIVRASMQVAGRVLFSGVPTGVAVAASQHHGGPFPASTAPYTTSVGYAAAERFLRPMTLQEAPAWLLARNGAML